MYKINDKFEFVIYKENFLSDLECDKLIKTLDTDELTGGELVGDYRDSIVNKNVRRVIFFIYNLFYDEELEL